MELKQKLSNIAKKYLVEGESITYIDQFVDTLYIEQRNNNIIEKTKKGELS